MTRPLITRKLVPRQLTFTPTAVLMGKAGVGKTTLAKKLFGITDAADIEESKVQKEENVYSVVCGRNVFVLLDTPETTAMRRPSAGADSQESDTKVNISTIFFIIKYDARFERMINVYFELEASMVNDINKIVLMISHWDQTKTPEEDFKEIRDFFLEECPHLANIIFYSEQYVDAEVAELMYSCISNMVEIEWASSVSEDEIQNSIGRSYDHCQASEDEIVNQRLDPIYSRASESIDGEDHTQSTFVDDSNHNMEEPRIKNNRKRAYDICESDSDSFPTLRDRIVPQPVPCSSFERNICINKTNKYVGRDNRKKRKTDSNILRRWWDYCCIL